MKSFNYLTKAAVLVPLLGMLASCNMVVGTANGGEKPKSDAAQAVATPPAPAAVQIPCFGCHDREAYDGPGAFPHENHRLMGLHCNQCHVFRAHYDMSLNGATCAGCHNLGVMRFARTSMPATFNHQGHASRTDCAACHDELFRMKAGTTSVTMDRINHGKDCGACHDGKTAFSGESCDKCHS